MNDLANSTMTTTSPPKRIDFNTPELQRKRRIRALKDRIQVLERIATDNNRAVTLDQEIEKLRDRSAT